MLLTLPFGLLFGFFGSMPSAGPSSLLVFDRGLRGAFRSAMALAAGAALAESGYAFLAYWGMGELFTRHPELLLASRGAAACILTALGLWFVFHKDKEGAAGEREHVRSSFALGLGVTAMNPTFLATWTAAVAVLHSTRLLPPTLLAAGPFAIGVGLGIFAWFAVTLALIRRYRERFSPATVRRALQVVGVALVGMGIWAAISFARSVWAGA